MRAAAGRAVALIVVLSGCQATATGPAPEKPPDGAGDARLAALRAHVPDLLRTHRAAGAGVAIIDDGAVIGTAYFGEQGPATAAGAATVFNTASVAKTIAAETLLALAAKDLLSLDEPIHGYVSHPDLSADPRFRLLTPRLLLSHRAGLKNWPYEYGDDPVSFVADPGTSFSYSGMGIELAAQFAENKLGQDFEALAFEHVLTPLGIREMSMGRWKPWLSQRLATPMNAAGDYVGPAEPGARLAAGATGRWSAADDLLSTVDAYTALLLGLLSGDWLTGAAKAERTRILTDLSGDPVWHCEPTADVVCAGSYGHGLGWMVYEFADKTVVKHGGNDAGENALVIYSPDTRDGAVIFVNGGNGIFVSTQILDIIGDEPEIAAYYRQLIERFYATTLSPVRVQSPVEP